MAAALVAASASGTMAASAETGNGAGPGQARGRAHVRPLTGGDTATAAAAPAGAHLTYFGGPIISNVAIHSVYWAEGSYQSGTGPGESAMEGFFTGITASPYMDWLGEYNANGQTIGRGTYTGHTKIQPSAANDGVAVDATNIEDELFSQLAAGALPAPQVDAGGNVNTLYGFFFPQGKTLTADGGVGGQVGGFCAYHGTIVFNGLMVPYMVLPDFDDPLTLYEDGCGPDQSLFNNFTGVVGHEIIESITDPAVGLARDNAPPLAWYDIGSDPNDFTDDNGEIADFCFEQGHVRGGNGISYVVQAGFSNVEGDCQVKAPSGYENACEQASPSAFTDAGTAADCLNLYGVALGKDDGSFGENDPLLRSQVSSLLARLVTLAGSSLGQTRSFPDVTPETIPNAQVRSEIELLAGSGIIAGFPDGLFHPGSNLTLAQGATLVVRTLEFIHADHPAASAFHDQGPTATNYHYAIATGVLDTNALNLAHSQYPSQVGDTTNRGLLADMLAQSVQRLVTHGVVSSR
jgi:hypothetical protein